MRHSTTIDVDAVNRHLGLAVTNTGEVIPITNWFIGDGDDCPCAPSQADQCVAGPLADGGWLRIDLSGFDASAN